MPLTQHLQGTEGKLSESPEFEDNLFYKVSSQYSKGHTEKPCFTLPPISIHVRAHTRAYTHTHTPFTTKQQESINTTHSSLNNSGLISSLKRHKENGFKSSIHPSAASKNHL